MTRILLAGASGFIGASLLQQLTQASSKPALMSISRRPLALKKQSRVLEHVTEFSALEGWMTKWQADVAVCCLGTTIKTAGSQAAFRAVDFDAVLAFARLAKRIGVQHFMVVSAVGADQHARSFYSRVKGEMEAAVEALGFAHLSIIQPSLLLGARTENRLGERIGQLLSTPIAPAFIGPLAKYRPVHGELVASAMAALALAPIPAPGIRRVHYNDMVALA